jgi:hypothetical protein
MVNELLLPKDWCEALAYSTTRFDIRDANDETQTVQYVSSELFEHARWSLRYELTIKDHRDQYWMTMTQSPATENQECETFLFTRMVDGVEYVVFEPAEPYEVIETRYRKVPSGF